LVPPSSNSFRDRPWKLASPHRRLQTSTTPSAASPPLNLYRDGILKLDELITETYSLDQVNQGYADIAAGRVLRGVIAF
jgi:Zn-dependent alcohol dehydrogenase